MPTTLSPSSGAGSAGNPYQVPFETDSPTTPGLDGLSVAFMKGAVDAYDQN